MTGGNKSIDEICIELKNRDTGALLPIWITVWDNSLAHKWLEALNHVLEHNYHLEKNYCFFGFPSHARSADYICDQINQSIAAINAADLGYQIQDYFTVANSTREGGRVDHDHLNQLHRYFEDLQGWSGGISNYYNSADDATRWHIRQLNLLCHEFESLILSIRKLNTAPEWQRPSQLMCWLSAPRFVLEPSDYELFGVQSINRSLGGVFVGVNKAVGKHHWEVFTDEGRDSRLNELTTSSLRPQTEAAGDFDIEWGRDPGQFQWQQQKLQDFEHWLRANGFDPADPTLTIGHPQVGQVDLVRSFGTEVPEDIWHILSQHLDVHSVTTSQASAIYNYCWSDSDFCQRQIQHITQGK